MRNLIALALIFASFNAYSDMIQYKQNDKTFYLKSAAYVPNSKAIVYQNKALESAINDCNSKTKLIAQILKAKQSGQSQSELLKVANKTLNGDSLAEFSRKVEIIYSNDNAIFADNNHTFSVCLKEFHGY